jgi:hypothetical protein
MKRIVLFCISVTMIYSCDLQAQGILGRIKKEVTKKDPPAETKPATTSSTSSSSGSTNTGSSSSSTTTTTTQTSQPPVTEAPVTPILEWPETKAERVATDAYTIPTHAAYIGKIVFSDKKLTVQASTPAAYRTSFNVDEPVYARVFLKTAVKNYALYGHGKVKKDNAFENSRGKYHVRVYIDGQLQDRFIMTNDMNDGRNEGWNTWQLYVSARGEDAKENNSAIPEAINKLPTGSHTIKLALYGGEWDGAVTAEPLAVGEFTYNKAEGKKMKQGRTWSGYKDGMVNAVLTKDAVEAMNKEAISSNWKETFTKAKIKDKEWTIIKNGYTGIVLSRTIDMYLYATWPDGHCTVQIFAFEQQYGAGQFSKLLEYKAAGDQDQIDCD